MCLRVRCTYWQVPSRWGDILTVDIYWWWAWLILSPKEVARTRSLLVCLCPHHLISSTFNNILQNVNAWIPSWKFHFEWVYASFGFQHFSSQKAEMLLCLTITNSSPTSKLSTSTKNLTVLLQHNKKHIIDQLMSYLGSYSTPKKPPLNLKSTH